MSDNWIIIIPEKPDYVPSEQAQRKAVELFRKLAPDADEVNAEASAYVRFIDCGENLQRVLCPECAAQIEMDWWHARVAEEIEAGCPLRPIRLLCCGVQRNLDELKYEWPAGFAKFNVEAMNPNIEDLDEQHLKQFEAVLGCRVRKILQHV